MSYTLEYWKEQAEAWHREFGKMVDIRDRFVAELDAALGLKNELLEALQMIEILLATDEYGWGDVRLSPEDIRKIEAALRKAKGE